MHHVAMVIYLFIVPRKKNQKKRNIKSRKIDKKKRKMLVFKYTITVPPLFRFCLQRNLPPLPSLSILPNCSLVSLNSYL